MEYWDLYDRDRIKTGETGLRGAPLPPARFHMVIHICIFNPQGELLIQKRSQLKAGWPGKWDLSVGGAAQVGDSSWQTAQRELAEELGLLVDFSEIRPSFTVNFERGFDDVYLLNMDIALDDLHLQAEEVTEVKWANETTLHQMIDSGEFLPYYHSLISMLFEMRFDMGMMASG